MAEAEKAPLLARWTRHLCQSLPMREGVGAVAGDSHPLRQRFQRVGPPCVCCAQDTPITPSALPQSLAFKLTPSE